MPELMKEILEGAEQVVGTVLGKPVTRGELTEAFKKVEPAGNWKLPISAKIAPPSELERAMIREAVIFFTGSIPVFLPVAGGKMLVAAPGYYATIGA